MRLAITLLVSLVAPAIAAAAGPSVQIVVADKAPPLERQAAEEVAAVLTRLYGADAKLVAAAADGAENVIYAGSPQSSPTVQSVAKQWPEQMHVLKSTELRGKSALIVGGGSPVATYWAAAELAHQLGVRSMLYGDLDPVAPPAFTLKGFDIIREPLVLGRTWQMDFDSPLGPATWSLADQQKLLRQLARLKFNRLVLSSKAESPAAAIAAYRPIAVSGDTSGRAAFAGAKLFQNPELAAADTEAARREAADKLIQAIDREAKALGMTVEIVQNNPNNLPGAGNMLPVLLTSGTGERLRSILENKQVSVGIQTADIGDADLDAFAYSRACFGADFAEGQAVHDLVTPVCGEGVSERVLKAFELAEGAASLTTSGDFTFGSPTPNVVLKNYASSEPPPEWWGKARDNYLNAMNEMYRANTRAREGGRSYTLYFARRFEFAFEYMNSIEALRKAAIAKSKGDADTQIAELEKAVESMNGGLNAMAAVARSQSDRGIIAVLNEYGYRPLVKELEAAQDAAAK